MTIQDKIGAPLNDDHIIPPVKSLLVDRINYNVNSNSCLILDFLKDLPVFVQSKYILQLEGNWHLCVKVYLPIKYNKAAHAYEIECQPSWLVVFPQDLIDSHHHNSNR